MAETVNMGSSRCVGRPHIAISARILVLGIGVFAHGKTLEVSTL